MPVVRIDPCCGRPHPHVGDLQRLWRCRSGIPHHAGPLRLQRVRATSTPTSNAERNILISKASMQTEDPPEMACGSSHTIDRKQEEDTREGGSSALQGRE